MKKLVLAFAAAATLGLTALATTGEAEARGGHGFRGGHGGGFRHVGIVRHGGFGVRHFGHRHWGHRHWSHRHWGWRGYGVRYVGAYGGSCWRYRLTPYGYRYVNVCRLPVYY